MQLNYSKSGQGSPLFILHGLFGTWENFGSCIKELTNRCEVIAVDLRNHGRSPHSDQISYPLMADDVIELANTLGIEQFALLGHSMGGKVAMQLALNHPDRVTRLIVVDIAPVQYPHHHQQTLAGLNAVPLDQIKSRTEADQYLARHISEPNVRAFLLKNLYRTEQQAFAWRMNLAALEDQYDQIAAPPCEGRFDKPVLFIKGSESDYLRAEYQDAILTRFPNTQLRIIDGAGHWPHAEKPALFLKLVTRFLDQA